MNSKDQKNQLLPHQVVKKEKKLQNIKMFAVVILTNVFTMILFSSNTPPPQKEILVNSKLPKEGHKFVMQKLYSHVVSSKTSSIMPVGLFVDNKLIIKKAYLHLGASKSNNLIDDSFAKKYKLEILNTDLKKIVSLKNKTIHAFPFINNLTQSSLTLKKEKQYEIIF